MVARQRAVARSEARSSAHEKAKHREALAEVARHVEVALGEARHLVAAEGLRAEVEGHRLRPIESGKLRGGGGALKVGGCRGAGWLRRTRSTFTSGRCLAVMALVIAACQRALSSSESDATTVSSSIAVLSAIGPTPCADGPPDWSRRRDLETVTGAGSAFDLWLLRCERVVMAVEDGGRRRHREPRRKRDRREAEPARAALRDRIGGQRKAMLSDAAAHTAGGDGRPVLYSSATPDDDADPRATQPAPAASTSSSGYDSLTTVLATKGAAALERNSKLAPPAAEESKRTSLEALFVWTPATTDSVEEDELCEMWKDEALPKCNGMSPGASLKVGPLVREIPAALVRYIGDKEEVENLGLARFRMCQIRQGCLLVVEYGDDEVLYMPIVRAMASLNVASSSHGGRILQTWREGGVLYIWFIAPMIRRWRLADDAAASASTAPPANDDPDRVGLRAGDQVGIFGAGKPSMVVHRQKTAIADGSTGKIVGKTSGATRPVYDVELAEGSSASLVGEKELKQLKKPTLVSLDQNKFDAPPYVVVANSIAEQTVSGQAARDEAGERKAHHEYIALALCIDEEVERMGFLEPLQRIRRDGEGMTPAERRLRT